ACCNRRGEKYVRPSLHDTPPARRIKNPREILRVGRKPNHSTKVIGGLTRSASRTRLCSTSKHLSSSSETLKERSRLASELVRLKVDVIVTAPSAAIHAVKQATRTNSCCYGGQ